jgi:nucleoid-associated protein YgaU
MLLPLNAAADGLDRAYLEIVEPRVADPVIPLRFNPTEYRVNKENAFAAITIPGLSTQPIQYVNGNNETLTAELLVDTSDTLEDVRKRYTDRLRSLMDIDRELHAPPIVQLVWGDDLFRGVVQSLGITFTLFAPDGTPLRAALSLAMMEYRPVELQVKKDVTNSPDVEKAHVVRRGDSLAAVAALAYADPTRWREIAEANGIDDPRRLEPGTTLDIPRLR